MIFFWECYVNVFFFANFKTNELIFKSIDERMRTDLKWVIFTFAASKCYTVNFTFEI